MHGTFSGSGLSNGIKRVPAAREVFIFLSQRECIIADPVGLRPQFGFVPLPFTESAQVFWSGPAVIAFWKTILIPRLPSVRLRLQFFEERSHLFYELLIMLICEVCNSQWGNA